MPDQEDLQSDLALLRDPEQSFFRRADAVRRLARNPDGEAHAAVVAALRDREPYVRRAAAEGLAQEARLGDLPQLLSAFEQDTDEQAQRALLKALGEFPDPQVLEAVKRAAASGNYGLRYDAQSLVTRLERQLAERQTAPPEPSPVPETTTPLRTPEPEPVPEPPVVEPTPPPPPEPPPPPPPEPTPPPVAPPVPEPPEEPKTPSAGTLEFRSVALGQWLAWVPVAIWPGLLLLCWGNRHAPHGWLGTLIILLLAIWRRGVQFDGFTKTCTRWSGPWTPFFRRHEDYAGLTRIEVREYPSRFAEILAEDFRQYMRLELGYYDVVVVRQRGDTIHLKRCHNLAAAMVAARQTADFLALPMTVHQAPGHRS